MRLLSLLTFLFLAACGQAGDLYLPDEKPAPAEPAAQPATPAPAETPPADKDKDKDEDKK